MFLLLKSTRNPSDLIIVYYTYNTGENLLLILASLFTARASETTMIIQRIIDFFGTPWRKVLCLFPD